MTENNFKPGSLPSIQDSPHSHQAFSPG